MAAAPRGPARDADAVLITRRDCPLCDQLRFALDLMAARVAVRYELRDVDGDAALRERFGDSVPVLLVGDRIICNGHFDIESLEQRLRTALDAR